MPKGLGRHTDDQSLANGGGANVLSRSNQSQVWVITHRRSQSGNQGRRLPDRRTIWWKRWGSGGRYKENLQQLV